jgi:hypothetical protein
MKEPGVSMLVSVNLNKLGSRGAATAHSGASAAATV